MSSEVTIKVNLDETGAIKDIETLKRHLDDLARQAANIPTGAAPVAPGGAPRDPRGRFISRGGAPAPLAGAPGAPAAPAAPPTLAQPPEAAAAGRGGAGAMGPAIAQALLSFAGQSAGGVVSEIGARSANLPFVGGPLAAYLGIKGASLQAREALAGQAAGLEGLEAQIAGAVDIAGETPREATERAAASIASLGFGAGEARQLMATNAGAFGLAQTFSELEGTLGDLAAAQKAGLSPQMISSLAGAITQAGTGPRGGVEARAAYDLAFQMRNLAESGLDLRGAGVNRFLAGMQGAIDTLAGQGITTRGEGLAATVRAVSGATGRTGTRPLQITQALGGAAGGARAGFAGQFGGLVEAAIQAEAFSRAETPLQALQIMEQMQADPRQMQAALRSQLGGEGAALALASIPGIGAGEARQLAGGMGRGADALSLPARQTRGQIEAGLAVSAAQAAADQALVNAARSNEALLVELTQISADIKAAVLKFTETSDLITGLAAGIAKALDTIARFTP